MANGIVALLDNTTTEFVESIWAEFQQEFGVHGVSRTPIAHFSFHVAEAYSALETIPELEKIATDNQSFTAQTAGLGIFTGTLSVVHIPVVRNAGLTALHQQIWDCFTPLATGVQTYYHPDHWQPHITLAQGDIPPEKLPDVIAMLQTRDFNLKIEVSRLGFIADTSTDSVHQLQETFDLGGNS